MVNTFTQTKSGQKSDDQRPQLAAAIADRKKQGAIPRVAKLACLARNIHFVSDLMNGGIKFVANDLLEVKGLTIHIIGGIRRA